MVKFLQCSRFTIVRKGEKYFDATVKYAWGSFHFHFHTRQDDDDDVWDFITHLYSRICTLYTLPYWKVKQTLQLQYLQLGIYLDN